MPLHIFLIETNRNAGSTVNSHRCHLRKKPREGRQRAAPHDKRLDKNALRDLWPAA